MKPTDPRAASSETSPRTSPSSPTGDDAIAPRAADGHAGNGHGQGDDGKGHGSGNGTGAADASPIAGALDADPGATGRIEDRRHDRRIPVHCALHARFRTEQIAGTADNVSATGVLFLSDEPVHVTIEFEEDGVVKRMHGRVVRAQRMKGESLAWAVELDA